MKYNKFSRRMFLQGTGGTLVAIPFLSSLLSREALAQTAAAPKRFISIFSGLDYGHNSVWIPGASSNIRNIPQPNRTLNVANGHHAIRWQPLREFAPTASSPLASLYGTSVSAHLEYVNIMRSLDFGDFRGHDGTRMLGGARLYSQNGDYGANWKAIPTIDHVLNNNRRVNPAGLPLAFGGWNEGPGGNSWSLAPNTPTTVSVSEPIYNMQGMYNALFQNGSYPESGTSVPAHPRREILNSVIGDFRRVMGSRNISSSDRIALSNAMDKFSDIHRGLQAGSTGECSHRQLSRNLNLQRVSYDAQAGRQLADMITASIMCDSARVFTLGLSGGDEMSRASAVPNVDLHQNISHTPFAVYNGLPAWQHIANIHAQMFRNFVGPLIQNLASATDPSNGRSYLYNSLVYASAESGQTHGTMSSPVFLAGNAGGTLTSGNYIDYADRTKGAGDGCDSMNSEVGSERFSNNWYGVSYNRLMVTILQAFGFQPADYEDESLNQNVKNATDLGPLNMNLSSIGGWGYASSLDFRNRSGYYAEIMPRILRNYDLKQYRNKLPMPTS